MSARLTCICLAGAALVVTVSGRALAAPGAGVDHGSAGRDGDVITAAVSYRSVGMSGAAAGSESECTWELSDATFGWNGLSATWPMTIGDVTYHIYMRTCPDGTAYVQVAETTPQNLLPSLLEQLRQGALPKPVPVFELLDHEFGWAYVRTPLDFRAGEGSWRPVSVTASVGPVWATVTATPKKLTFDPGDPAGPGPVSCDGDGPVAPYVAAVPGACSYTYTNASSTSPFDGYHFQTSMEIDWSILWTSSTGAGGTLAPYTTSASALLAVAEVKALVTCTGSRPEQGGCG
jgi:hypothetical protein